MNILTVKGNRIDNGVLYYPILNNTQTLIVSLANFEKNLARNKNAKVLAITATPDRTDETGKNMLAGIAKMIYPKAEIIIKDDLKETNFGDFENKNYDQLKDDLNYQRWLASGGTFHIPNGESREEFSERCEKCFEEIINQSLGEECVALIIHGGTIMAILDKYSNPHKDFYNWQVKNGQGYIIEIDKNTWINDKKVQVIKEI